MADRGLFTGSGADDPQDASSSEADNGWEQDTQTIVPPVAMLTGPAPGPGLGAPRSNPEAPPGIAPGAALSGILQMLAGGNTDPLSLLLSQITNAGPSDPNMAMLGQLLQQRTINAVPEPEPDAGESAGESEREEAQNRLAEVTTMVNALYAETEKLRARNAELADALGACPVCFGTDLLCSRCGGRGRPGGRLPRPEAYRAYVVPVVMRVRRLTGARPRPDTPVAGKPPSAPPQSPSPNVLNQGAGYAG